MTPLVRFDAQRRGYVIGHRTHHGTFGCALLAVAVALPDRHALLRTTLIGAGAALIAHDWPDRSAWLPDLLRHPEGRR